MIEFLKHFLGLCGDGHVTILNFFGFIPLLIMFKSKIIMAYQCIILYLKKALQRLH